jgi:hypothetical protein
LDLTYLLYVSFQSQDELRVGSADISYVYLENF